MAGSDNLIPFSKGYDPRRNLKGRPPKTIPELDELLEKHAGGETPEDAQIHKVAEKLMELGKGGNIEAIKYIFDRVYGKLTDKIDHTSGGDKIPAPIIQLPNSGAIPETGGGVDAPDRQTDN